MPGSHLVFLDFDGVLHPGLAGTFIYAPDFETFLQEHRDVQVVFSTSWREEETHQSLTEYFSPSLRQRFIGVTPVSPGGPGSRWREIRAWLSEQGFGGRWVALDDDATLFPPGCAELVRCDTARGLRKKQVDEMRAKLHLG